MNIYCLIYYNTQCDFMSRVAKERERKDILKNHFETHDLSVKTASNLHFMSLMSFIGYQQNAESRKIY